MTSSATAADWLPAAIARAAVVSPSLTGPRHLAPDAGDDELLLTALAETDVPPYGRHAEPEWSRDLFDPRRDGDPFAWLGFADED